MDGAGSTTPVLHLNSLASDLLAQVATLTSSAPVWEMLETMYSAQSRARITNLQMQLATCKTKFLICTTMFLQIPN
jgi:hypothetical protein